MIEKHEKKNVLIKKVARRDKFSSRIKLVLLRLTHQHPTPSRSSKPNTAHRYGITHKTYLTYTQMDVVMSKF